MNGHPLDQTANLSRLHEWRQAQLIDDSAFLPLVGRIRSVQVWRDWGARCLLILGIALLLCGIVFFFAWNWDGMQRWQRLALAAASVLLPALASRVFKAGSLLRKLSVLAASMTIGVFLAAFGQAYQTGADTHQLFFAWAALSLLWVLCATFEPLWALWLAIVSTALSLYWIDVIAVSSPDLPALYLPVVIALLHGLALIAKEGPAALGWKWLQPRWSRLWLLFITLAPLSFMACMMVLDISFSSRHQTPLSIGSAAWLVCSGISFAVYRHRIKDAAAMALSVLAVSAVLVTGAIRTVWRISEPMGEAERILTGLFFNTIVVGGIIAGTVWLLRRLTLQMAAETSTPVSTTEPDRPEEPSDSDSLTWRTALQSIPPAPRSVIEQQLTALARKPREPAWLKAISAIGGWIAAWTMLPMLVFFIGLVWRTDASAPMITLGALFLAASVAISRSIPDKTFLQQMNLALAVGSFTIINIGFLTQMKVEAWGTFALMQCVISAVTYPLFKDGPYRFLVSLWSIIAVVMWRGLVNHSMGSVNVTLIIVILALATAVLWAWRARPAILNPLAYALALGLAGTVFFHALVLNMAWRQFGGSSVTGAISIAAALVGMIAFLNRGVDSLASPWLIGVALIAAAMAWFGEMGVLTAMLLTIAAFAWGDKLLSAFAWIFLAGFMFFFYYQMAVPLSMKAAIIGGSGAAFLALRFALLQFNQRNARS